MTLKMGVLPHELAGSKDILHLHAEFTKARSTQNKSLIYNIGYKAIEVGDLCELGSQLRPHIVWFGEAVPEIGNAANLVESADILVVIGTSLSVYPSLLNFIGSEVPISLIYPCNPHKVAKPNFTYIEQTAVNGVADLKQLLVK
jgi:NAD-dependent deacetylase